MTAPNPSHALALTLLDELARNGVRHAVLAPGSRSAPLALALAADDRFGLTVSVDERSAAFLALGLARATGRPALLVCTSGTAAANFLPAVVEADNDGVPLIVATADRPPELRGTGANQTVDQIKLYGDSARWFCELGVPEGRPGEARYWRSAVCRAVAESTGVLGAAPGPVHLNLALREPLVPEQFTGFDAGLSGRAGRRPWTEARPAPRPPAASDIEELAQLIDDNERGVIVAGAGALAPAPLLDLARAAGYPVLAEPASNARIGDPALAHYESLLRCEVFADRQRAGLVVRFGKTGLSRALARYLESCDDHVAILRAGMWLDPQRLARRMVYADPELLCSALIDRITRPVDGAWLQRWTDANLIAKKSIDDLLDAGDEPSEPRTARDVAAALPDGSNLVVAASMPVRDLDAVMTPRSGITVFGNRGANGIDGFVSTALGIALGSQRSTVALCGDLSLLHDQNGLLQARSIDVPCVFVVLNNDGGGIFSFLEQADHPQHFERVFGTPHGVDFEDVARTYGCGYVRIETAASLGAEVIGRLDGGGVHLVEVRTERAANTEFHRAMHEAVARALAG